MPGFRKCLLSHPPSWSGQLPTLHVADDDGSAQHQKYESKVRAFHCWGYFSDRNILKKSTGWGGCVLSSSDEPC